MPGIGCLRALGCEADGAAIGGACGFAVDRFAEREYASFGSVKDAALVVGSARWDT